MMQETFQSIGQWCLDTFGPAQHNIRLAARANEEMAELLKHLAIDDRSPEAQVELVDVIICLCGLAHNMGVDVQQMIDAKMNINRHHRTWRRDGTGCGYHIKEAKQPE